MIKYSNKQKLVLRLLSLPAVALLLLILYIVKYIVHLIQFTRFGGEFLTYGKDEVATIDKIYQKLKEDEPRNSDPDKENKGA